MSLVARHVGMKQRILTAAQLILYAFDDLLNDLEEGHLHNVMSLENDDTVRYTVSAVRHSYRATRWLDLNEFWSYRTPRKDNGP